LSVTTDVTLFGNKTMKPTGVRMGAQVQRAHCDERIASLVWAFLWKLTRIILIEWATLKLS
jgi:hypothetical protein